jgi:hypothetical protein
MNRETIGIIFAAMLILTADFSMALSIECNEPKVLERDFSSEDVQWFRSDSKTDGEFSEGYVIDGILPLIKEGLPFTRLLVDLRNGEEKYSFELFSEEIEGEGIGFTYEQSLKIKSNPKFRAFYKSHEVCPKYIYVFTATYSTE